MSPALAEVDQQAIEQQTGSLEEKAKALIINSPETYQDAASLGKIVVNARKTITDKFKPIKDAAHKAHREICDLEKEFLNKVEKPERLIKGKMATWADEQERLRQQQLAKERAAREEAARKEAQARREAEERAAQETARLKKEEEERRLARAQELEDSGQKAEAEKLLDAPSNVEAVEPEPVPVQEALPVQEPLVEKASAAGASTRKRWSAEVVDLMALVEAVADGKAPLACLVPDQTALNRMAVTMKEAMDIPGVRARSKTDVAIR